MAGELGCPSGRAQATMSLVRAARCAGDLDGAWQLARQAGQMPDIPGTAARACGCLLATVLGVRPAEPGFKSVRIAPHLGPLQHAEGRVPHPLGSLDVRLARTGDNGLRVDITLPPGLEGVLEWGGKEKPLRPGRQQLSF